MRRKRTRREVLGVDGGICGPDGRRACRAGGGKGGAATRPASSVGRYVSQPRGSSRADEDVAVAQRAGPYTKSM